MELLFSLVSIIVRLICKWINVDWVVKTQWINICVSGLIIIVNLIVHILLNKRDLTKEIR